MKGIDISNNNKNVDFDRVKAVGIEVVIMKATEGVDYKDTKVEEYYSNAKGKFNIGFYHFMSERTSPSQQAIDFYNVIKDKEFNVLPCLDIENNKLGRSASQITDRCIEFLNKFKELSGYDCMIYTGGYFGRDNLDSRIKGYPGWIAHYGVSEPMETGFKVVGHQYTETGFIDGVGKVDLNNFTDGIFISNPVKVAAKVENWISKLQAECNNQGYSNQVVDGLQGPNTLKGCPVVKEGAKGDITKLLQEKLVSLGYNTNGIDGIFGNATYNAVRQFQRANNLFIDGVVGKNTWSKLLS